MGQRAVQRNVSDEEGEFFKYVSMCGGPVANLVCLNPVLLVADCNQLLANPYVECLA